MKLVAYKRTWNILLLHVCLKLAPYRFVVRLLIHLCVKWKKMAMPHRELHPKKKYLAYLHLIYTMKNASIAKHTTPTRKQTKQQPRAQRVCIDNHPKVQGIHTNNYPNGAKHSNPTQQPNVT